MEIRRECMGLGYGNCCICDQPILPRQIYWGQPAWRKESEPMAHEECAKAYRNAPKLDLYLFEWELMSMDEYSRSVPSGTTVGKFWRTNIAGRGEAPIWAVYAYMEHAHPSLVRVVHFNVVLKHGPHPPLYIAPDWSYFKGWQREHEARA